MAVKLSLGFLVALIAFCWGLGKGKSVQIDTEWLLGHCAGSAQDSDTICWTTKEDPVSCVAMAEVKNCESAAASFSEMAGAEIQDLTDESFAVDENKEYMCFLPKITEDVDSFIGFVVEIEQLQTYDFYSQVWSFGCSYPKGLTSAEDVEKTICCRRFSQTFLKDDTIFFVSTHGLPSNMTGPPKSRWFEVGKLKTISLANYKVNFIDKSLPNIVIKDDLEKKPVDDDADAEKFPILEMSVIAGAVILGAIMIAAVAIYSYSRSAEIPAGDGDALPEAKPTIVCKRQDTPKPVKIFYLTGETLNFNNVNSSSETSLT